MKTSIKTIAATIALTALMAGPASAATKSEDGAAPGVLTIPHVDSDVLISIDNNVATVTGNVRDELDRNVALRAAKSNANIDQVIDLTTLSN